MTEKEYFVCVAPPEYTPDKPASLWRRCGETWEYLSLIDWSWHGLDSTQVVAPPPEERLVAVDPVRAERLASDRQLWARYWVLYRDPVLAGRPDEPVTVIRRRCSPESSPDEAFGRDNTWVWTSVLVEAESGYASDQPSLREIDVDEAEELLQRIRGVTGATGL